MKKNILAKKIEQYQSHIEDDVRDYIGASSIGSECYRQIWYEFKGVKALKVSSKIRRTWAIGKLLESLVINWLRDTGLDIATSWYDLQSKEHPYFRGHVDAVLLNKGEAFAIIEVKTAKDSSFKIFVNKGLKVWNEQYYAQIQSYMGMSGINRAYILVINKDNSELLDEFVQFDEEYYKKLEEKAEMISKATIEPPKISNSPLWYKCKTCKFNKVCHK